MGRASCLILLLLLGPLSGCGSRLPIAREHLIFHTVAGDLECKLYPTLAPQAVAEMIKLVRAGVFDQTQFGWVERGKLLQLGFDLRGQPLTPQQLGLLRKMPNEFSQTLHRRGLLYVNREAFDPSMKRGQICIWLGDGVEPNTKRTIFGEVESGWDVLDELELVPTMQDGHTPSMRVEVARAEVIDTPEKLGQFKLVKAIPLAPDCHVGDGHAMSRKIENGAAAQVSEQTESDGRHVKQVFFKNLFIDRIYQSMRGPWKSQYVLLNPSDDEHVWITRYRALVVDSRSGAPCQEFMCHTNIGLGGVPGTEAAKKGIRSQMSISQGQMEVVFPAGFALCVNNHADRQLQVTAMVLNNNQKSIQRVVDFNTTLYYYDDAEAGRRKLVPLYQTSAFTAPLTDPSTAQPGEAVCKPADPPDLSSFIDGRPRSGHWVVPAGRQVITQDVTKTIGLFCDTTVHYIWMHVHPYAESMELRDATSGQTVWKGMVQTPPDPRQALVLSTDSYSSTSGLPLYQAHRYELTTVYNNRTDHDVDAMAALWMYVRHNVRHD